MIDLSLLPAEITHIIVSVMARITLEALQRYRRDNNGEVLPLVLVMEEAHTFIVKERLSVTDTISMIERLKPDYVGINIFTQNYDLVRNIVEGIRTDCVLFVGGQGLTINHGKIGNIRFWMH